MSSFEKRARENKRAQKKKEKALRRRERREQGPGEVEVVTQEDVTGELRSIDEVMAELLGGPSANSSRSAASIPSKLFVGGLSYDTDNASLRKAFEAFGEVTEAAVITDRDTGRSRGFGFVTMADRKDAAQAIRKLNGQEFQGRTLVVRQATERK